MLKCQLDSFLKQFSTTFVEAHEGDYSVTVSPGIQETVRGIALVLEDTILFPEGGGQPCDQGMLKIMVEEPEVESLEVMVKHVFRKDGKVLHLVEDIWDYPLLKLPPGIVVHETLFWSRRKYHMMHHSGQHLVSGLAYKLYGIETLSWCLGTEHTSVDLDTESMSPEQIETLEAQVNAFIRNAVRVSAHVYQQDDPRLETAISRGLPEGYVGDVRVIVMEGIKDNKCCGTHVSNLNQLEDKLILFLTAGEDWEGYMLLTASNKEFVATVGPRLCHCMMGRGQLSGNRYQGRVFLLSGRKHAEQLLNIALKPRSKPAAAV